MALLSKRNARYVIEQIIALCPSFKPSLDFENTYQLLIAVMLSAQTTDKAVNQRTPALFKRFPNPRSIAEASPEQIAPYISTLGLYVNKSRFIYECACQLLERFDGEVPSNRRDLQSLSGVGRKTANVVLSVGFNVPAFAVDTHVSRVCKHHKIVKKSALPLEIEQRVMNVLPQDQWIHAHQAMIYFGRTICHPKDPICEQYPQLYDFV